MISFMLEVEDLHVSFGSLHAVRGVSLSVKDGKALGIVGESGCGKSSLAHAIARLTSGKVSGKISLNGLEIRRPHPNIGIVFQDPMSSLNPTMKIGAQIMEGLIFHKLAGRKEAKTKALELLHLVKVSHPEARMRQYPHELSGGMRQRVLIAIALACNPSLLIADEPTTALDATVQVQILDLIKQMQNHFKMGLLLISHDFGVIAKLCDEVLVMYAGKIVERGSVLDVLHFPKHPYTKMLLNSLPRIDRSPLIPIDGSPPTYSNPSTAALFKKDAPMRPLNVKRSRKALSRAGEFCDTSQKSDQNLQIGKKKTSSSS